MRWPVSGGSMATEWWPFINQTSIRLVASMLKLKVKNFVLGLTKKQGQNLKTFLGWGLEDVYLATNVINHNINVFRSVEPELVHLFHHKHCDPKLSPQQLDGCIKEQF